MVCVVRYGTKEPLLLFVVYEIPIAPTIQNTHAHTKVHIYESTIMMIPQQVTVALLSVLLLVNVCLRCSAFTTQSSLSFVTHSNGDSIRISSNRRATHPWQLSSTAPKKGFGSEKAEESVKEVKPKTAGAQKRDDFSKKYDEIAATGGQEYRIFVRQFGSNDQSWLPCGLIAVPRGAQVSTAIYSNVLELQKAIVRTYPKLKDMEQEFEYGYNLKIYPDDPIEVAKNTGPTNENMFSFGGWMKNLLSPIDTSTMPRPPPPP